MPLAQFLRSIFPVAATENEKRATFDSFTFENAGLLKRQLERHPWLSHEDVEDLFQETLGTYWEHYWDTDVAFPRALLLAIANKKAKKKLRDRRPEDPLESHSLEQTRQNSDPNSKILFYELLRKANFDAPTILLLELRYLQQWSYPELADYFKVNASTLKSRVKKAQGRLSYLARKHL
jgi:RNA polymerase sigma factor (sigma-70 family)